MTTYVTILADQARNAMSAIAESPLGSIEHQAGLTKAIEKLASAVELLDREITALRVAVETLEGDR